MSESKFLAWLGGTIRAQRLEKRMTQSELAKLCGFEKASMSRIESGRSNITILTLRKICTALETDITTLISRPGENQSAQSVAVNSASYPEKKSR